MLLSHGGLTEPWFARCRGGHQLLQMERFAVPRRAVEAGCDAERDPGRDDPAPLGNDSAR